MDIRPYIEEGILAPFTLDVACPEIQGVAIDSRCVQPGDLFIALQGDEVNGGDYVPQAIAAGARAVLFEEGCDIKGPAHPIPYFYCKNIRKVAAQLAHACFPSQPEHCVAITGTNGKSSVVSFLRQFWSLLGHKAASLGTLGLEVSGAENPFPKQQTNLTTPDIITFRQQLGTLHEKGIDHLAFEASSHGLDQYRLDGVALRVAAFTNFSQDHLDYHLSIEAYFQAKLRLFTELLPPDGTAVINLMDPRGPLIQQVCQERGIRTLTLGQDIQLLKADVQGEGQMLKLRIQGEDHTVHFPLPGSYQVENLMTALGVLLAEGFAAAELAAHCSNLQPIPGRLEPAAPGVYVDYAHTPEALKAAIHAIPHEKGHLWVVFGCGGDRDADKRPLMGQVVAGPEFKGKVIITDDNPRHEDPASIRKAILSAVPNAFEIGDRKQAIRAALSLRGSKDKILIAGKGHETYQIQGDKFHDFDDRKEVRSATLLWDSKEAEAATKGRSTQSWQATGVSIDTRTLVSGDLFVALRGENGDGHAYLKAAFDKGAAAALVSHVVEGGGPQLVVEDTLKALEDLGQFAKKRATQARRIAITGSVGKTSTKEMLRLALSPQGLTHASASSYNNHWGVPLTLARLPQAADYAIFEVGMNHAGEITPLTQQIQPHVALITNVEASHLGFFNSVDEIAEAKGEIFNGVVEGGTALLNRDNAYYETLLSRAEAEGITSWRCYGTHPQADARLSQEESSLTLDGEDVQLPSFTPHQAENAAGVLLAVKTLGGDLPMALKGLMQFQPVEGRGDVHAIRTPAYSFTLINESYNANPVSMGAALKVLGGYANHRKVAVIGDMRELGDTAPQLHKDLLTPIKENAIDVVYCCGPHMAGLYEKLPSELKGGYTESSQDLIALVKAGLREGDVVMIKGSLGTRMKPVVQALLDMHQERDTRKAN